MSTKRKYGESDPMESIHESRKYQMQPPPPTHNARPSKKPRRFEPPKAVNASSVNAWKKRIRDVTRRLERSTNLPADVRVEDERALAAYQQELAAAEEEKIRQKMIKKYHMVRFFGMWFVVHAIWAYC